MEKILILLVMMLGLVGCGSEQSVDPTTIPTPTEIVTTTPVPTEAPVESEDEMKDYYVDPNTGNKIEIAPTETPVVEEELTTEKAIVKTVYCEMITVADEYLKFSLDGSAVDLEPGREIIIKYLIPNHEPLGYIEGRDGWCNYCAETWELFQWWGDLPYEESRIPAKITIEYLESNPTKITCTGYELLNK